MSNVETPVEKNKMKRDAFKPKLSIYLILHYLYYLWNWELPRNRLIQFAKVLIDPTSGLLPELVYLSCSLILPGRRRFAMYIIHISSQNCNFLCTLLMFACAYCL